MKNETCQAVDHNEETSACWMHGADSSCGVLMELEKVNHYRLKVCEVGELLVL